VLKKTNYNTLDEIKFICMMVNDSIQLPMDHTSSLIAPLDKLENYQKALKHRTKWRSINKNLIVLATIKIKEQLLEGTKYILYKQIYEFVCTVS